MIQAINDIALIAEKSGMSEPAWGLEPFQVPTPLPPGVLELPITGSVRPKTPHKETVATS